ncbi:TPA: hypothetical protein PTV74_003345 [Clostridium botulinum]|nr:hypothetical protein [Clostridium botulinum]HDK7206500.1 hypothetical protein [Clostridium botulinum]HDK7210235.1 hypothetical protein [Clostridium botulinum]HDK7265685.1 hypothetical protein [Clostridium botulinum]HDK7269532.1 hypothetical protein [Clostridium botulinum]
MEKKKCKSIFLARKVKKYYELIEWRFKPIIEEKTETLERVKILEKEMDFEFEADEEIYLEELEKYTKVQKKTRDTNGNIIYNITYVTETIVEDCNENLKEQYNELLEKWNEEVEQAEKRNRKKAKEKEQQEKEFDDKYNKFIHEKEKVKKDKIIIFEMPKDIKKDWTNANKIYKLIEMKLPMNYNIIASPFQVTLCNSEDIVVNKNISELSNMK